MSGKYQGGIQSRRLRRQSPILSLLDSDDLQLLHFREHKNIVGVREGVAEAFLQGCRNGQQGQEKTLSSISHREVSRQRGTAHTRRIEVS